MKEPRPKDELLVSGKFWEDSRSLWDLMVDRTNRQSACNHTEKELLGFIVNLLQKWQVEMVKNLGDQVRFSAWYQLSNWS